MKERIQEFLAKENKSSAHFAEEIGVQPSGISHILSGRNNPSLDFVIKMLERYPYLSTEWLLFGKGPMYREKSMPTLFDDVMPEAENRNGAKSGETSGRDDTQRKITLTDNGQEKSQEDRSDLKEIIWFFKDGTFKAFVNRKD